MDASVEALPRDHLDSRFSVRAVPTYLRAELALARGLAHDSLLTCANLGRMDGAEPAGHHRGSGRRARCHEQAVGLAAASDTFSRLADVTPLRSPRPSFTKGWPRRGRICPG